MEIPGNRYLVSHNVIGNNIDRFYLTALDSAGNIIWSKQYKEIPFASSNVMQENYIRLSNDGNLLVYSYGGNGLKFFNLI